MIISTYIVGMYKKQVVNYNYYQIVGIRIIRI